MHYQFQLFNPDPGGGPDRAKPYDLTGYSARFILSYTGRPHVMDSADPHNDGHEVVLNNNGTVDVVCPASETATWHQGNIPWALYLIPPEGEDGRFEVASGTMRVVRSHG